MPIVAVNVTMRVVPLNVACPPPGGVFTVTATVTGRAAGVGGIYGVEIFDRDPFFLKCDANCNVDGPLGNSGESDPTIYAYVDAGGGVTATSGKKEIACVSVPAPEDRRLGRRVPRASVRRPRKRR